MTPFVIITTAQPVIDAVQKVYTSEHFKYIDGVWFVADEGVTAQEVHRKLIAALPDDQKRLTVVICAVGGYYGVAQKNLWEWLSVKGGMVKNAGA